MENTILEVNMNKFQMVAFALDKLLHDPDLRDVRIEAGKIIVFYLAISFIFGVLSTISVILLFFNKVG